MKMKSFLLMIAIVFSLSLSSFGSDQVFKLKILKKEERELFGGLGSSNGPIGCALNFYISEKPVSSLTFHCGSLEKFKEDWLYIFSRSGEYWACPKNQYIKEDCLKCTECAQKIELIRSKSLSLKLET